MLGRNGGGPALPEGRRRARRGTFCAASCAVGFLVVLFLLFAPGLSLLRRTGQLATIWLPAALWWSPNRAAVALEASGPVFVKLAQWLSTRRDLLSDELCDAMGLLHENVRCQANPKDGVSADILVPGITLGPLLGGGCIAQVYVGHLPPGFQPESTSREVAVKVRRKRVPQLLDTDLALLRHAARTAEWFRPELQWLAMEAAIDHFAIYMDQQLNLSIEASNLRRFRKHFASGKVRSGRLRVPQVVASSDSVMVTEIARGVSLAKFIKRQHPEEVKEKVFTALVDTVARMILVHDFIHADLHPGNVFIDLEPASRRSTTRNATQVPVVTLIDAGIAIEMSKNLTKFAHYSMQAAFKMDALALGRAIVRYHDDEGLCSHAQNLKQLEHKVGFLMLAGCFMCDEDIWGEMFESYEEYRASRVSEYFAKMLSLLSEHRVRVSPPLWSLMTAFALVEGSMLELGHGVNVLRATAPYLFSSKNLVGRLVSALRGRLSEKTARALQ